MNAGGDAEIEGLVAGNKNLLKGGLVAFWSLKNPTYPLWCVRWRAWVWLGAQMNAVCLCV